MTMFGLNLFGKVKPKEVQNPSFVSDTNARGTTRSVAHQHLHEEQLFLREENKRLQEMVRVHERECVKLSAGLDEKEKTISKLNSVLNDKERVIGGLFYKYQGDKSVLMDKMVIAEPRRGTNISRGLLEEFINRMQNEQMKMIITGFLHPGYFYKFGFVTEKDQGGLVKYL